MNWTLNELTSSTSLVRSDEIGAAKRTSPENSLYNLLIKPSETSIWAITIQLERQEAKFPSPWVLIDGDRWKGLCPRGLDWSMFEMIWQLYPRFFFNITFKPSLFTFRLFVVLTLVLYAEQVFRLVKKKNITTPLHIDNSVSPFVIGQWSTLLILLIIRLGLGL